MSGDAASGPARTWLVATRELRERSRSRAFRASVVVMLVVVAGLIVLSATLSGLGTTHEVGLAGTVPGRLATSIGAEARAADMAAPLRRYATLAAGERALRRGDVDVLVVNGRRLEWKGHPDAPLAAVLTGAVQRVALEQRAVAAGISPSLLGRLLAPIEVRSVELGPVAGRGTDDTTAAFVVTVVLLMTITTYGNLVLTGVVEEKASRVVEVLLARIPARNLLAGKIAGIGLLGLGQVALTVATALVAIAAVGTVHVPAARASVLAWVLVWFVLGYALYATVYGALGSLASRTEDAQSAAGPVTVVLLAAYFAAFAAIGEPESTLATFASYFPPTAPLAMPNRVAMGVTAWWEPFVAAVLVAACTLGLLRLGGRVYASAILHTGPSLTLREAWRGGRRLTRRATPSRRGRWPLLGAGSPGRPGRR